MEIAILCATALLSGAPDGLVKERVESLGVSIHSSIEASLQRVSPDKGPALAAQAARLIRWRGNLVRDVHPGDRLSILFTEGHEGPELEALHFEGLAIALRAYRFEDDSGVLRYYDEEGLLIEPSLENNPVPAYVQITADVQRQRGMRKHNGVDLKAPAGTPVVLPFDARVMRVNWSTRVNGNCVEVRYSSGVIARFLHLEDVAASAKGGAGLAKGALLGTVGSTGRSSAPHLHYELRNSVGKVLRPLEVHGTRNVTVPPASLHRFKNTVTRWASVLEKTASSLASR